MYYCSATVVRVLILLLLLLLLPLPRPTSSGATPACAARCAPGFTVSAYHPVVLDGALKRFSVQLRARRRRRPSPRGSLQSDLDPSLPLDVFHVNEQVREFCWFSRIKPPDCNTLLESVQTVARSAWENATATCHCARDAVDAAAASTGGTAIDRRIFTWRDSIAGSESLYLQMTSPRAAQTLLGVSLRWHKALSVDAFGHALGGWTFPPQIATLPGGNEYIDRVIPQIVAAARLSTSTDEGEPPPRIFLVPPIAPGALPWTAPDSASTVIVVFDSDSSTEHPKTFLERVAGCDSLLHHHRGSGVFRARAFDVGLIVLGDNAGIFPTSVYSSADWALRQYYFEDHMETYNDPTRTVIPRWLPLSRQILRSPTQAHAGGDDRDDREEGQQERPILVLAVLDAALSERHVVCERESAEHRSAAPPGPDSGDHHATTSFSARCYQDWRRKGIVEGMASLHNLFGAMNNTAVHVALSPSPDELHALLQNASFVVAPPEHLTTGCESRLLWTALHAGAIPIVAGPANRLGLAPLGADHPLPQVPSHDWGGGLVKLLSPLVKMMAGAEAWGSSDNGGGGADGDGNDDGNDDVDGADNDDDDDDGVSAAEDASRAFVTRSAAHGQIQRLRTKVRAWFADFERGMLADIVGDIQHARRNNVRRTYQRQKQPFEFLLQSYQAWERYNIWPDRENLAEETYLAASSALRLGLEPSLLRIFAHEQMASVEQLKSLAVKRTGVFGWQAHNRRALVAISEALRVVLGEFTSERPLFPWLPKLLLGAGALAWDLSATRAGEALTKAGLAFNPLSALALEQLLSILREIQRHGAPSTHVGAGTAVVAAAQGQPEIDKEQQQQQQQQRRRRQQKEEEEQAQAKYEKASSKDAIKYRIQSLHDYMTWVKGSTGYSCNDACRRFDVERWTRWPVLSKHTAGLWWRSDELHVPRYGVGVGEEKVEDYEEKGRDADHESKELSTNSVYTYAARLVEEMAASCIPIQSGERDGVDELMWLLDTEDTAPLMTLLESSPFRIGGG